MTQPPGVGDRLIIRPAARFGLRGIFAAPKTLERDILFAGLDRNSKSAGAEGRRSPDLVILRINSRHFPLRKAEYVLAFQLVFSRLRASTCQHGRKEKMGVETSAWELRQDQNFLLGIAVTH
jgi:hypothetical protein